VSKWSYNVIGLYEAGPASVRLAYNHRSANVDSYTAPGVFATAYSAPVGRLDLSASYDFTPNATITVDATNLLKQPYKSYVEAPAYPRDVRYEGRIFSIGARLRY
jgi:outer membrane receptor protein involved in Fe transport